MKFRTLLLTAGLAAAPVTAARALDQAVIDQITGRLAADGYTQIRLRHGSGWADVVAIGPQGQIVRRYDGAGDILRERAGPDVALAVNRADDAKGASDLDGGTAAQRDDPARTRTQTRTQRRDPDANPVAACDNDTPAARSRTETRSPIRTRGSGT